MVANRQDAWTPDDDLLLAEVTLRHIREGSTQLAAFEEVAERLGRTPAACGFRWNSTVRKKYEQAIAIAKAQRNRRRSGRVTSLVPSVSQETAEGKGNLEAFPAEASLEEQLSFDAVIAFLRNQKAVVQDFVKKTRALESELKEKDEEIRKLREEIKNMKEDYHHAKTVSEDYRALIQIMDRARKMAFLGEEEDKPVFKMDVNGNLERVNQ